MFKSRRRIAEEEAKRMSDYVPTKDLKCENEEQQKTSFPWGIMIVVGIIVLLIVSCIIVIFSLGGPIS